ncbi:MAG: AraC family transcriptional regulator [Muribaculaceae bacterium]|nr:AraC family transcriptional regulator [Muribaculaceae bacterium]
MDEQPHKHLPIIDKPMREPELLIKKQLPQFDMPIDFLVYDDIRADLLKFYASFPCKIYACVICYVARGTIKATVNLWDYEVKQNDYVVLMPGSFIQIKEVSDDVKVCFAGYSSKFLDKVNFWKIISPLMVNVFKKPIFSLSDDLGQIYHEFFSLMTKGSVFDNVFNSNDIAQSALIFMISTLHNAIEQGLVVIDNKPTTREQTIVSEFLQLAFENYHDEHKISFYAHEANLTLSHFCNVIRKTTGFTPQEIIMSMIIMDAQTQLKGTGTTVSRIAASLGFNTPTTFNRYFRKYTGMTPQEYRSSNTKKSLTAS